LMALSTSCMSTFETMSNDGIWVPPERIKTVLG
jgi:hypothetical protein